MNVSTSLLLGMRIYLSTFLAHRKEKKFKVCGYVNEGTATHFILWWVTKYSSFNESLYLMKF